MTRRSRKRDAAVVLGVPAAFAIVASLLAVSSPSSAAGPEPAASPAVAAGPAGTAPPASSGSGGSGGSSDGGAPETEGMVPDLAPPGERVRTSSVKVLNKVKTRKPVFFITIDDGTVKSAEALRVVRRNKIPVTVFLTAAALQGRADYFRDLTAFGGSVQNHTYHHKYLNQSSTDVDAEVCGIQQRYKRAFGQRPWMLRPPGGFGPDNARMHRVVEACGIDRIVMWNVVVTDTSVQYVDPPLHRGDIVILHFTRGLGPALERVLALGRKQGLRPAPLEQFLPSPADR